MGVLTVISRKCRKASISFRSVVAVLMLAAVPLLAQIPVGTILGVVKDTSGGVVPQAKVTVLNVDTNETRTATTGDDGAYRIPAVPTGHYTVKFEKAGFKTETQTGFTLDVAQELVVNPALQVGASAQEVTVTGEAPLVNTTTSSLGGLVNEDKMAELPLNGRNYVDLTLMQPGISQNVNMGTAAGVAGTFYSSNGAPIMGNNISMDGAFMITTQGGSASVSGTTLGVDGIKEYKVITTAFSAEYGMTFGSQTAIVSKGGSNQWHGDVYDYLRNSSMDARNYFDNPANSGGKRLPALRRNNFGAAGGGPIRKDKTFFYAVYEGLRQTKGFSALDYVPPVGCYVIVANPCSVGGAVNLAVQPVLAILANEVTNNGKFLTNGVASTTEASMTPAQWAFPSHSTNSVNFGQIRIDQNISASDSLFGRWTIDNDDLVLPQTANAGPAATSGTAFPDFQTFESSRNQFVTLGETHIFSPTLLNSVHASFSRVDQELTVGYTAAAGGPTGNNSVSFNPGYPIGGWTLDSGNSTMSAWGNPSTSGPPRTRPMQNIYTGSEDLFWVHGKHSYKVGFLYNRFNNSIQAASNTPGTASFLTLSNFYNGNYNTLAGKTPISELNRDFLFNTFGFYIQDDWRATSRLTLNLGFRYEFYTTPYELFNRENSWIVNDVINGTRVTEQSALPGPIINNRSTKNFSPRVGFAYDLFGTGKTAVHGAFGIYGEVGIFAGTVRHDVLTDPPYSGALSLSTGTFPNCSAGSCPASYNGFGGQVIPFPALPAGVSPLSVAAYQAGYWGNNLDVADYAAQGAPHVAQWNFTVDQQLPAGFALTVSYVGTRGLQLFQEDEGNYAYPCISDTATAPFVHCDGSQPVFLKTNPQTLATNQYFWNTTAFTNTTENQKNPQAVNASGVYTSPSSRMNPFWGATTYNSTHGDSWYHGLQLNLTRRLSKGLQMQAAYTYSKVLDTGQGNLSGVDCSASGGDHGAMPLDESLDRGPSCFDVTHNFRLNLLYHFPNMKSTGFVSKFANGWWMGNIVSIASGYPFTAVLGGNTRSGAGTAGDRPNLNDAASLGVAGCLTGPALAAQEALGKSGVYPASCPYPAIPYNINGLYTGNPAEWFNPNMFSVGPPGFFGDAGRDQLRGPGLRSWNFSITKDTHLGFLGEAGNLEFRAEIFNMLNHPIFPTPSGTVIQNGGAGGAYAIAPNNGLYAGSVNTGTPGVGAILTTAGDNRQVQLALKILF